MKTSIFVLSALFASSEASKIRSIDDTNYLSIGTNVRSELQGQLRGFLEREADFNILPGMTDRVAEATRPPPGTSNMTNMPFTRLARHVEQRFTERKPYERFPAWILPGSEAILPKKSADLNLLDDEMSLDGNFHYKANYDPSRELLV